MRRREGTKFVAVLEPGDSWAMVGEFIFITNPDKPVRWVRCPRPSVRAKP